MTSSFAAADATRDFLNDGEKLEHLIEDGFDLDKRCQYDVMALKFQFNKLVLQIRQFMMKHQEQECIDVYKHLKMLREVNDVFFTAMNIDFGRESEIQLSMIGTPRGKSTPRQYIVAQPPQTPPPNIIVSNVTGGGGGRNSQSSSAYRTAASRTDVDSQSALLQVPDHQRVYMAVQNLERTLNSLPSPMATSPRPVPRVAKKITRMTRLKAAALPRKGLNFQTK